jgi:hypothetical protein
MTVVTFVDYVPLPRHDGIPWIQVNIFEAETELGPWVTNIETIPLVPLDADPANPMVRNFTTEEATLAQGWYMVQFEDATGDTSDTDPLNNVPNPADNFLPTISDVGALVRARTKDDAGNEIGTFTSVTRPTGDEVLRLIDQAAGDVTALVDYTIPVNCYRQASSVIALRAAMLVELSYFPEQINTGRSPYEQFKLLFDDMMARLKESVDRENAEDPDNIDPAGQGATGLFPVDAGGMVGWQTRW